MTTVNSKKVLPWMSYLIFLSVLNETVFNVAIPKIAEQFTLGPAGVSWVMTSFMIFFGIGAVIYGKLSDIFSVKQLIIVGCLIYCAGSIIGFAGQSSYPVVVAARTIQGMGASAIPALIFVVIARYFPVEQRGKVFGTIGAVVSLGIGVGPVIGGFIAGQWHWSLLFLVPVLTLIAVPFLKKELPHEARRPGSIDIFGAILVSALVGTLVLYLNSTAWYYLTAVLMLAIGFVNYIRRMANPFIDPKIFTNRLFRTGVFVGLILFSIVIGILFVIPLLLHAVHGLDTATIGLILFPGAISSVVFGPLGGRLADKKGNPFVLVIGLGLLVASLVLIALFMSVSPWLISACLLLLYVGFSLFQTALINSVSQTLPLEQTGVGMGIFNLVSIISGAMGTALVGKILDGHWFSFKILPFISSNATAFEYTNLLLIFSIVAIGGGMVYLRSYRGLKKPA